MTEPLYVTLSDDQLRLRGQALALAVQERAETVERRKASMDAFKEDLEAIDEKIAGLSEEVSRRQELREVEVAEQLDYQRKVVDTVRTDTGEIVRSRAMTEAEGQRSLFATPSDAVGDQP